MLVPAGSWSEQCAVLSDKNTDVLSWNLHLRTAAKQFSWATAVCLFRSAHKAAMGQADRRVLVLGAGYVAHPAIEYLSRDAQTHVTIGTYCCTCHETHRHMSPSVRTAVPVMRHTDTCHHQYVLLYLSWDTQTHVTISTYCCTCHETHRHMSPSVCTAVPVMRHTDTCHHRYVLLYLSWDTQTHVTIGTYCCTCHETHRHVTVGTYCCTCHETHRHMSLSAVLSFQKLWFVHTDLWLCPSQSVKHENGSCRCPSLCRNHSGGDRVALAVIPLTPPPGISVPTSTSPGTAQHWMSLAKCLHSWTLTTMLPSILTLRLDWKPVVLPLTRLQLPGTSSLFLSVVQPMSVFSNLCSISFSSHKPFLKLHFPEMCGCVCFISICTC